MLVVGIIVTLWLLLVVIGFVVWRKDDNRYHRSVEAWAGEHGWIYRKSSRGRTWKTPLPSVAYYDTQLQVDGIHADRRFTLVYARAAHYAGSTTVVVEVTAIVVHLQSVYPATKVVRRSVFRRPSSGVIGHAAFDKKFRVQTDAQGGPAAVVSVPLAEAHLVGEVPLWILHDQELMCRVGQQTPG